MKEMKWQISERESRISAVSTNGVQSLKSLRIYFDQIQGDCGKTNQYSLVSFILFTSYLNDMCFELTKAIKLNLVK